MYEVWWSPPYEKKTKKEKKNKGGRGWEIFCSKCFDKIVARQNAATFTEIIGMNDVTGTVTQFKYLTAC